MIITPYAAARLSWMIADEPDADKLGIRLIMTTTGCGSYTYSIAITEKDESDRELDVRGIRLFYKHTEEDQLAGILIDCDAATNRFSISHSLPLQTDCPHIN
ncbi:hypothetical protein T458_03015 [Brevibacillus panacihumi W25]|uniref:Core domain-containing protein n=1 Tax=Brevibacillus panacihumi W25 TaxID=1408254 RepID=V6MCM4_9BACL|nr:iron-sulfur cluster biosynthesis family protein [Brevibacillus panacihumi]EST56301.1 hypothetical protein T458_03015 [Brevibacillus panacihumi W25]